MRKVFLVLCGLILAEPTLAEGTVYRAVIGDRIHALITIRTTEDYGDSHVFYDASGGDGLRLSVAPAPAGSFDWRERDDSSGGETKITGHYKGTWSTDGKSGQGVWKSADGKRNLSLVLARLAQIHTLVSKEPDVEVDYLEFDDPHFARLNEKLAKQGREQFTEEVETYDKLRKELKKSGEPYPPSYSSACDLESIQPNLVSLFCKDYAYDDGHSPHGIQGLGTENVIVGRNGASQPMGGLWSLLQKSPATIEKLSALIVADLKRQQASSLLMNPDAGDAKTFVHDLERDQMAFTVVPGGLAFHFAPDEVGSHAEGYFRAVIPNRALADVFRADGPLADRKRSRLTPNSRK
jgi:hypothetical protein